MEREGGYKNKGGTRGSLWLNKLIRQKKHREAEGEGREGSQKASKESGALVTTEDIFVEISGTISRYLSGLVSK